VNRRGERSIRPWIYAGSIAAHVAFFAIVAALPAPEKRDVVAIDFADIKKKAPPPPPPPSAPPAPHLKARPKPAPLVIAQAPAKVAPEPAKEPARASPVGADGFADLGGVPLAGSGPAVRDAGGGPGVGTAPGAAAPKATSHRVKQLVAATDQGCTEAVVKPKVRTPGEITYTKEGQEAEIEGAVRVQVTVDEAGKVIAASVLTGLGYGLDERALAAARDTIFEPATLCGTPVVATKILSFNFELR
jgi:protein TonB